VSQAFFVPTRVFSGTGCLATHSSILKSLGTKALIVTGRHSAVSSGAGADVVAALEAAGIASVLYEKIPPNPGFTEVREAAKLARAEGADFVVGIGGGSPLDAAKAIAVLAVNDLDDDALFLPPFPKSPLPIAAVPTTAGTGSEVTPYAILTNDKIQSKSNISHESIFPKVAFLDPRYTYGLPRAVTVNTALDALSHLVEGYLAIRGTEFSQVLALQGMALLGPALRSLASDQGLPSPSGRQALLLASATAGMVIAHTGTTAVHALGYSLTYFKGIDHGRANALTLAEYLAYLLPEHTEKVQAVVKALGLKSLGELKALLDTLLGARESLSEEEIHRFAAIAVKARNMANTLTTPTEEDLAELYRRSFL